MGERGSILSLHSLVAPIVTFCIILQMASRRMESFNSNERALLGALADELIPAGDGFPSASQAEVAGHWLDVVLEARPDLAEGLKEALAKADGKSTAEALADLRSNHPAAFGVLTEVVPGAYFMNPEVRQRIGYSGQTPKPIDPRPDYMEDGLLESVIRRGPIYRPTPDQTVGDGPTSP